MSMNKNNNEVDFSVRVNSELKNRCSEFCNENNITLTDFIKALIEDTVKKETLPFSTKDIKVDDRKVGEKSSKLHIRLNDKEMFDGFRKICEKYFLNYHVTVKAYMRICLDKNKILCPKKKDSLLYNTRDYMKFKKNEQARKLKEEMENK